MVYHGQSLDVMVLRPIVRAKYIVHIYEWWKSNPWEHAETDDAWHGHDTKVEVIDLLVNFGGDVDY